MFGMRSSDMLLHGAIPFLLPSQLLSANCSFSASNHMKAKANVEFQGTYTSAFFATACPIDIFERAGHLMGLVGEGEGACKAWFWRHDGGCMHPLVEVGSDRVSSTGRARTSEQVGLDCRKSKTSKRSWGEPNCCDGKEYENEKLYSVSNSDGSFWDCGWMSL